jgi:outer membrane murein-binding lipoprotein Lpp
MRPITLRLALAALALTTLTGCEAAQRAEEISTGVDKAADCAALIRELGNLDLDPRAAAATAEQAVSRLDRAVRNVDAQDVRQAAEDLRAKLAQLRDAARDADPARQRQAVEAVRQSAERLARTCNVPVDQLTGGG